MVKNRHDRRANAAFDLRRSTLAVGGALSLLVAVGCPPAPGPSPAPAKPQSAPQAGPTGAAPPQTGPTGAAPAPPQPDDSPSVKLIGAGDLIDAYAGNEVSGDMRFKGKLVQIDGWVERVAKDIADEPFVAIRGPSEHPIRSVQVYFDPEHVAELARFVPGSPIIVRGTVEGLMVNVLVKHGHVATPEERRVYERSKPPVSPGKAAYDEGAKKAEAQDFPGAIAAYTEALRVDPSFTDALLARANAKLLSGDAKGSLADFDGVLAAQPDNLVARGNRAMARQDAGDLKGALEDADAIVKAKPDDAESYVNRSFVRSALGDSKGAIEDDTKAITLKPDQPGDFYRRGKEKDKLGDKRGCALDWLVAVSLGLKKERADDARDYIRAHIWTEQPTETPPAESPQDQKRAQRLKGKVEGAVHVWGNRIHVTARPKVDSMSPEERADWMLDMVERLDQEGGASVTATVLDAQGNVTSVKSRQTK